MSKPKIRFNGFTEDWEQRKFSDIVIEKLTNGVMNQQSEFQTNVRHINVINMYVSDKIHVEELAYSSCNNIAVEKCNVEIGDIFLTRSSLKPEGIAEPNVLLDFGHFVFDDHLIRMKVNKEKYDPLFTKILLSTKPVKKQFIARSKQNTFTTIGQEDIAESEGLFPTLGEQQEIGKFFSNIDHLITLYQCKCEETKILKKYMLQKMFPKDGERVPEIRFSGFTNAWEQRKFGDIFEEYSEKGHPELPVLTIIQGGGTIRRDESDRNVQYDKANLSNYKTVNDGDFIVHLRSFEGGLEKATTFGIISPAYHTFHGEGIDSRFYYSYFRSPKFIEQDLKPHVYGIRDGRSIDIEGMKTIEIPWTSFEEQQAIGGYIATIDHLITLHQHKCDELKSFKRFMLQNMFL